MNITKGKIQKAQRCVLYGTEGIGKSTFASKMPAPLFIDTEGSTNQLDVTRFDAPQSWTMLLEQVRYVITNPHVCKTLVIDTLDWSEKQCVEYICARSKVDGLEGWGYGKGYTYLAEEFAKLLHLLDGVIEKGIHVFLTAHAQMKKIELPDEIGSYDRWEMKLGKKTAPMVKEWCDLLLFANYKTSVVNVDNQGAAKGKNKAQGGQRVMYTAHRPVWDAKNRHGLPEMLPLEYEKIAHIFEGVPADSTAQTTQEAQFTKPTQEAPKEALVQPVIAPERAEKPQGIPDALWQLMQENDVTAEEICFIVAQRGYYTLQTPIQNYDPAFIQGVLIGAWQQVYDMIIKERPNMNAPF